ncbi:hypothetical protein EV701_123107 [Chthoniobacter flavus]|uniref:hypothetical protein n=1 Tax=Chthoniobacter flavus TaxID=191863 RepID=UPI0010506BEC|nr:hypothetical protein [Chthoniobacter flavus]TCO87270.1 hypothetical protein EV701_123107 [Chthoniobacter flavus]
MTDEKFQIGSEGKDLGTFTKWELICAYNSLVKCEGIYVYIDAQPQPLWHAITKWYDEPEIKVLRTKQTEQP